MNRASRLKGGGYLTSTLSVILLGVTSLKSARETPVLGLCLVLGVVTSIAGMALRWRSHRAEQREEGKD